MCERQNFKFGKLRLEVTDKGFTLWASDRWIIDASTLEDANSIIISLVETSRKNQHLRLEEDGFSLRG